MTDYSEKNYSFLSGKISNIYKEIGSLKIKELEEPQASRILQKAKNFLKDYEIEFSEEVKKNLDSKIKELEDRIQDVEKSIELIKNK